MFPQPLVSLSHLREFRGKVIKLPLNEKMTSNDLTYLTLAVVMYHCPRNHGGHPNEVLGKFRLL